MTAIAKKVPLSIDTLLAAHREQEKAQSQPKFLTKAQRDALAAEKEKGDAALREERDREATRKRADLERAAGRERYGGGPGHNKQQYNQSFSRGNQHPNHGKSQGRDRYDDGHHSGNARSAALNYGSAPTAPRAMRGSEPRSDGRRADGQGQLQGQGQSQGYREQGRAGSSVFVYAPARDTYPSDLLVVDDSSIPIFDPAALKARYLGDAGSKKRKTRKQSDKKFVFDWDKGEDTATADEVDPFYRALRAGNGSDSRAPNGANAASAYSNVTMAAYRRRAVGQLSNDIKEDDTDEPLAGPKALTKLKAKGAIDERHWSEKTLDEMKERDWRIFREDFSIAARGGQIPLPLRNWQEASIPQALQDIVSDIGYSEPSAIQRQAIPIGLNVRDMIGIAETGSGKTAAFVIPMLAYIMKLPPLTDANRHMGPYALIMAPTRELAQQIEVETRKFTGSLGYKCVSIVGGRSMEEQALNMRDGAEIVIATPGRLKDCIERSVVVFSQCTYVVMDEADRMISLGFEDVINFILDSLPVSNMKPDTEEAEDAGKMLQTLIGGEDGGPLSDLYMYRQTVCAITYSDCPTLS